MGANGPQGQAQGTTRKFGQVSITTVVNISLQQPSYSTLHLMWRCTWMLSEVVSRVFSFGNRKSEMCWLKTSKWSIFLFQAIHLCMPWTFNVMKDYSHEWRMQFPAPHPWPYLGWCLQDKLLLCLIFWSLRGHLIPSWEEGSNFSGLRLDFGLQ